MEVEVPTTDSSEAKYIEIPSTYELDGVYMISDSCSDFLIRMKMHPNEKDEFVSLCQDKLQGNDKLLAILREFQESYSADQAIAWLNRDQFFRRFIDNIFQTASIDDMYPCRVFLHDIQEQLKQHNCASTIQVYRSEPMSDERLQYLKSFNGKVIAMKSFFMTNLDREKALSYTSNYSSSSEYKRILFIIEANPEIENVKPFAKIGSIGYNNDPNDVLFMIGSLFRITEIQDEKDGIINVKMTLCTNDDTNTLQLVNQMKYQYIYENGETDIIGFGQFLFDIGKSMRDDNVRTTGENFIRSCLDRLPNDHPARSRCYDALGNIELFKDNLDASLDYYKKSFDIKTQKLEVNDPNLADSYKNLALLYLQKGDSKQAFEYFYQLLIIWRQLYGDDYINLIFCYTNIAMIYENEENLTEAMSYYYQALALMVKHHTSVNEASFAALYNNLGNACTGLKHYQLSLGYYNASLEIKAKTHTPIDPSIAVTYKNIGVVHGYMNNVQQSRENLEKALEIYRQLYPPNNSNVTDIEELIRNLLNTEQSQ